MNNFFAMICIFCCITPMVYGMESEPIIKIDEEQAAWEIILTHGIAWFDYKMIGSLAVNKKFDQTILPNTADHRIKYLTNNTLIFKEIKYAKSHCYGSVQGKVSIQPLPHFLYHIWLDRQYVVYPMKLADCFTRSDFSQELPHKPEPFFNKSGDFCFYGYGNITDSSDMWSGLIVEYSVCANGTSKILPCVTNIKYGNSLLKLTVLLEFPSLLKAFFSSSKVYKEKDNNNQVKVFGIEGIVIPRDYANRKKYFSVPKYKSFNDVPEELYKAIITLYKMQNKQDKCDIV